MPNDLLDYLREIRLRGCVRRREWYWPKNAQRPKWLAYVLEYEPFTLVLKVFQYVRRRRALAPLTRSQRPSGQQIAPEQIRISEDHHRPGWFSVEMGVGSNSAISLEPLPGVKVELPSGHRRLILSHVYFENEAKLIFEKLQPFTDYDQVVTTSVPALRDAFLNRANPKQAACFLVPNTGRDVLPFLLAIHALDLSRYDQFVKVHTKRSAHLAYGEDWFGMNLETLIGDKRMTDRLLDHIDPGRPSLYGVETLSLRDHFPNNRHWLRHLTGLQSGRPSGRFIPGTMFAGSGQFLRELASANLHLHRLEPEDGQLDGCLVHALERYFGYLAASLEGEVRTLESLVAEQRSVQNVVGA